ncbi:hypothetical protein SISNIDRAFT_468035 [Sistotremastrum niveocremeum HHB9708]|uniref:Uncharacterized protein n=1 Tax=Sistotremastrum niveocremeum HHB9708 TaxID=1314777 RepID=A0A164S327_9AGAM|nr:hypothetical protein SISNIDRAFT_468035 [Sistotremastrum niveocremeum HHB9708]
MPFQGPWVLWHYTALQCPVHDGPRRKGRQTRGAAVARPHIHWALSSFTPLTTDYTLCSGPTSGFGVVKVPGSTKGNSANRHHDRPMDWQAKRSNAVKLPNHDTVSGELQARDEGPIEDLTADLGPHFTRNLWFELLFVVQRRQVNLGSPYDTGHQSRSDVEEAVCGGDETEGCDLGKRPLFKVILEKIFHDEITNDMTGLPASIEYSIVADYERLETQEQ